MASTGFAGGLAAGLGAGVKMGGDIKMMGLREQFAGLEADRGARAAEAHGWKKEDREKAELTISGLADIADGGMAFRTDGSGQPINISAPQQPVMMDPGFKRMPGFAQGGLIQATDDVFAGGRAPSDIGGLSAAPQQQPQQAPAEKLNPSQRITKAMMETDLLSNPDKLSKMQAYAEMNGMGDKFKPFLERAYGAKKQGLIDGGMLLMRGQVDEAIDALAKGGVKLEDRPTPADPKNPRMWNINISGAGEKVMDIADLLQTTLDVDKFLKHQMDKSESEGKRNLSDARVRSEDSNVRVDNARIGKLGEETRSIKEERKASGTSAGRISKLPAPAATAQWLMDNKVYSNAEDAFAAVKTLSDKSPAAARDELIKAGMKNGASISEAAKEVDEFLAQSGQGKQAPAASKVRKFNPKTGGFD